MVEATVEATAVMSRLQAPETRGAGATTITAQRFGNKEARALHDNMLKVAEIVESREGRLAEMEVKNAGMSQDTVDDFTEVDLILVTSARCMHRGSGTEWFDIHKTKTLQNDRISAQRWTGSSRVGHGV